MAFFVVLEQLVTRGFDDAPQGFLRTVQVRDNELDHILAVIELGVGDQQLGHAAEGVWCQGDFVVFLFIFRLADDSLTFDEIPLDTAQQGRLKFVELERVLLQLDILVLAVVIGDLGREDKM